MSKGVGASPADAAAPGSLGERSHSGDGIGSDGAKSLSSVSASKRRNPFYAGLGDRNNFPDLDTALKPETPPKDLSVCSPQIVDEDDDNGSSILNMSIGARASLNEHLRYVERFGIDGEEVIEGQQGEDAFIETDTQILDDHWEALLNSSRADTSNSVIGVATPSPRSRINSIMYADSAVASEESIEVLVDTSNDFFNSSRVQLLTTPERNKNCRLEMVTTREEIQADGSGFDNSMYGSDANSSTCYLSRYALDMHINASNLQGQSFSESGVDILREDPNSSFQSFNAVELSGISTGCSEVHQTPDTSFLGGHLTVDNDCISPILGDNYSQSRNVDSSFNSMPTRREVAGRGFASPFDQNIERFRSIVTKHSGEGGGNLDSYQIKDEKNRQKENVSPEINTSNSVQSTVSSFMAEARSLMKNMANEVELSIGALESFPADFLRAIEAAGRPSDPPSPISQVGSTTSSSQEKNSIKRMDERHSQRAVSTAPNRPLTGRKRFRTVVPRRVYLDSAATFDEEHDSFLAIQSNPETTRTQISLLESFEAPLHNTF